MGVLHMAIHAPGVVGRQSRPNHRAASRAIPQPHAEPTGNAPDAAGDAAVTNPGQRAPLSGTLLPTASITPQTPGRNSERPRHEATLQRTAEQEVAQEALD